MSDQQEALWAYRRLCERHGIPDGVDEVAWLELQLQSIETLTRERNAARQIIERLLARYNDAFEAAQGWRLP